MNICANSGILKAKLNKILQINNTLKQKKLFQTFFNIKKLYIKLILTVSNVYRIMYS